LTFHFFRIIIQNIQFEPNNNIAIYLSREVEGLALWHLSSGFCNRTPC